MYHVSAQGVDERIINVHDDDDDDDDDSYSGIMLLEKRRLRPNDDTLDAATVFLYVVAPVEPAIILLFDLYKVLKVVCTGELPEVVKMRRRLLKAEVAYRLVYLALPILIGLIYAVLVIVWIALYAMSWSDMDYVFSVAVCIGWLYTISFTRGIRIIHYFWRMIQNMVIKDILKFLFIYLFVLLAFSSAFHAIFQISQDVSNDYPTPFDTAFLVFNLMIGMGDLFDGSFSTSMSAVGRSAVFAKILYLVYMVLGTILLLNLLIAMMNDSYSAILQQHSVSWRMESVQLGVDIEKTLPISTRLFSSIKFCKNLPQFLASSKCSNLLKSPKQGGSAGSDQVKQQERERRDVWSISVRKHHVLDETFDADDSEREALREMRVKIASMEQRVVSDLQQVKHDLDDIRALLRDLKHSRGTN